MVAKFPAEYTGGWNEWTTIETDLLEEVSGVHRIYVLFKPDWGDRKLVNLDWLKLTE